MQFKKKKKNPDTIAQQKTRTNCKIKLSTLLHGGSN